MVAVFSSETLVIYLQVYKASDHKPNIDIFITAIASDLSNTLKVETFTFLTCEAHGRDKYT